MKVFALVACLVFAGCANAEEQTKKEERFVQTPLGMFLVGEALVAMNAGLATLDPQAYGVAAALLFPIAAGGEGTTSETMQWVGLAAAEGLAAYHIAALDKDEDSDKEIFLKSAVAWHAFGGILLTAAWLTGDLEEKKEEHPSKVSFRYQPIKDGAVFGVRYVF